MDSTPETRAEILAKVSQRWDPYARKLADAARPDETRAWRYMKQKSEAHRARVRARGDEPRPITASPWLRPSERLMTKARKQRPNYTSGTGPLTTRADLDELTGGPFTEESFR